MLNSCWCSYDVGHAGPHLATPPRYIRDESGKIVNKIAADIACATVDFKKRWAWEDAAQAIASAADPSRGAAAAAAASSSDATPVEAASAAARDVLDTKSESGHPGAAAPAASIDAVDSGA